MNKRREMLEKIVGSGKADSFALYALAMEYSGEHRLEDALRTFESLRDKDPSYLPMYLMAGQLLIDENRAAEAKAWLEAGVALAEKQGNAKAKSELVSALDQC